MQIGRKLDVDFDLLNVLNTEVGRLNSKHNCSFCNLYMSFVDLKLHVGCLLTIN